MLFRCFGSGIYTMKAPCDDTYRQMPSIPTAAHLVAANLPFSALLFMRRPLYTALIVAGTYGNSRGEEKLQEARVYAAEVVIRWDRFYSCPAAALPPVRGLTN